MTTLEQIGARIEQRDALHLQLALIAGNEPSASFVEVRTLHPDRRPGPRSFVPAREHARTIELIARLRDRHEVLVGVAPRTRQAGTADAVDRVWTLVADCDSEQSVANLRMFRPAPSIVVRSGTASHLHAYWALRAPMPPSWARAANKRLAHVLRSDAAVADPARVMRAIGSRNHKHDPPVPVVCVRLETDTFSCDQVVGGLPDPPERRRPPRPVSRSSIPPDAALEGLLRTVRDSRPGNRNATLHWAACRLRDHVDGRVLDEVAGREALREAALDIGLGEFEVHATIASGLTGGVAA